MAKEEDKAIGVLKNMVGEFESHKKRLATRAKAVSDAIASGQIADVPALGAVVVEIFNELHDTSLSFQADLTSLVLEEWQADTVVIGDDDEEEEEEFDGDEPEGDEDPSQLLPGDAAQLRRTTLDYQAMLDAMLTGPAGGDADARKNLEAKLSDAKQSLELIDELELLPDEDEPVASTAQPS